MKRIASIITICTLAALCTGCNSPQAPEPQIARMQSICELATMDCYYHDVAKTHEDDVSGILLWEKDLDFWVEYETVVTLGIDASLVEIQIDGTNVTITLPNAEIQDCHVESATLDSGSFYIAPGSATPTGEQQVATFEHALDTIRSNVLADEALLLEARNRAQLLLEQYVKSIGKAAGVEYTIDWVYLDNSTSSVDTSLDAQTIAANNADVQ